MNLIKKINYAVLASVLLLGVVAHGYDIIHVEDGLRGKVSVSKKTYQKALDMRADGWVYIMPQPKSPQASWGNGDGRTTWWFGYWTNEKTGETSSETPKLRGNRYVGDGEGRDWRRGGSPGCPTQLESSHSS